MAKYWMKTGSQSTSYYSYKLKQTNRIFILFWIGNIYSSVCYQLSYFVMGIWDVYLDIEKT